MFLQGGECSLVQRHWANAPLPLSICQYIYSAVSSAANDINLWAKINIQLLYHLDMKSTMKLESVDFI